MTRQTSPLKSLVLLGALAGCITQPQVAEPATEEVSPSITAQEARITASEARITAVEAGLARTVPIQESA